MQCSDSPRKKHEVKVESSSANGKGALLPEHVQSTGALFCQPIGVGSSGTPSSRESTKSLPPPATTTTATIHRKSSSSSTQGMTRKPTKTKPKRKTPTKKSRSLTQNHRQKGQPQGQGEPGQPQKVTFKPRIQGTGYTGGANSYVAARSVTSATTFVDKTGGQRIVDSGHFLAQTWWRKGAKSGGQRRKNSAPAPAPVIVPFTLQQCLFDTGNTNTTDTNGTKNADNTHKTADGQKGKGAASTTDGKESVAKADTNQDDAKATPEMDNTGTGAVADDDDDDDDNDTKQASDRGSRRLRSRSRGGPDLTLRCPICGKAFTASWLGAVTEDAMSRHVAKCTQKMFRGGTTVSAMLHRKKDLPRLFLGANPASAAAASATTTTTNKRSSPKVQAMTAEELKQKAVSIQQRTSSMGLLLRKGTQRAVLQLLQKEESQK